MLARHGYGVLLFDRRGEGASDGDPNCWGWGGDRDVKAAIAYLQRRPDVDADRIGGIGQSVGGELLLETAADTDDLAAVVSEGAGARGFPRTLDRTASAAGLGGRGRHGDQEGRRRGARRMRRRPPTCRTLAGADRPSPLLLIAAPNSPNGEELNRGYYAAARGPKTLWEIPEAGHTGGLAARPAEYERRVVGFFDRTLRLTWQGGAVLPPHLALLRARRRLEIRGRVHVGRGVRIDVAPGARVMLEDGCALGEGSRIDAARRRPCGSGRRTDRRARDARRAGGDRRRRGLRRRRLGGDRRRRTGVRRRPAPVRLGDGARIGLHAAVLAGAKVAPGEVVGAYETRAPRRSA